MTSKQIAGPDGQPVEFILPGEASTEDADQFVKASDNKDTELIVREAVSGMPADINIYCFKQGRKTTVGPSVTGITNLYLRTYKTFCEFMEVTITERDPRLFTPGPEAPKFGVVHRVAVRGRIAEGRGASWAVVEEPEYQHRSSGEWVWNKHAVTVACSKARRNVMRDLLAPVAIASFVKDCAKHSIKMLELTDRDAKGTSGETPEKARLRGRLFALVSNVIDVSRDEIKDAYKRHIETTVLGKRMSESTEVELANAVAVVEGMIPTMKKDEFRALIFGGVKS